MHAIASKGDHRNSRTRFNSFVASRFVEFLLAAALTASVFWNTPVACGNTLYVSAGQNTNSPPDGLSWATAFPAVQQAIDAAAPGDAVWVSGAAYAENLTLSAGVALYGGFAGSETDLSQRDWIKNQTVLDGRGSNSVVVVAAGATNDTRIDGFTIRNGKAPFGGGILCSNASPAIVNNAIVRNLASSGGAIRCDNASPLIAFNLLQENFADALGGAIECINSGSKIRNNRIIGNFLGQPGLFGGGICCSGNPSPEISDNLFLGNIASGVSSGGGGIYVFASCAPWIVNNTLVWNQAPSGGAIYCESNWVTIANNIIAFGSSGVRGVPGLSFLNNCVFANSGKDFSGMPDPAGAQGNIAADPRFASLTPYPDVHLTGASPCRDAGDSAQVQSDWVDLDGRRRLNGPAVDMGAEEFYAPPPDFAPAIVRVSAAGDDAHDGLTWASAKRTVQAGIDLAALHGGEVWVQAGTYEERLVLGHFVYLYGGFAGTETNRAQRDWKANVTQLDAGRQGTVVTVKALLNWNAVDGFVIQNGEAPSGGGIYCVDSSPVIANNVITGNAAVNANTSANRPGGGIYCNQGSPVITNNLISSNNAVIGGGIYSGYFGATFIANNRIEGNVAATGSGITGTPPYGGGGVYVAGNGKSTIVNNFFLNNIATNQPDAYQGGSGGAIACQVGTTPRIIGNTFLGNRAASPIRPYYEYGGGIYSDSGSAVIVNNLIAFGSSGIHSYSLNPPGNIRNNCVYGNATNYLRMTDLTGTNGNLSVDPVLSDINDFHLGAGSPCIDAGDDSVLQRGWLDLDGQARKAGAHVDIGADEYGSASPFSVELFALPYAGQTTLRLFGDSDLPCVIETSTDLDSWSPIITNTSERGFLDIPIAGDVSGTGRFYRAVTRP